MNTSTTSHTLNFPACADCGEVIGQTDAAIWTPEMVICLTCDHIRRTPTTSHRLYFPACAHCGEVIGQADAAIWTPELVRCSTCDYFRQMPLLWPICPTVEIIEPLIPLA